MNTFLNTFFESTTALRGARNLAVQNRTNLLYVRRAPCIAYQINYL